METREGFPQVELFWGGFSWPPLLSPWTIQQRAAGDALSTLRSPMGAAPEDPGLVPGQGDTCPLLVPTLGHLLKTPSCSGLKEVVLGLKELEIIRVESGLIKS